jgi:hypothetical protein
MQEPHTIRELQVLMVVMAAQVAYPEVLVHYVQRLPVTVAQADMKILLLQVAQDTTMVVLV